jgi:hypothetical protein
MPDEELLLYDHFVKHIELQNTLINNRLGWTLQANGFFFAALALIRPDVDVRIKNSLLKVLPLAGIVVCFAGLCGVIAALLTISALSRHWHSITSGWRSPRLVANWSAQRIFTLANLPALLPPFALMLIWGWLGWNFLRF